ATGRRTFESATHFRPMRYRFADRAAAKLPRDYGVGGVSVLLRTALALRASSVPDCSCGRDVEYHQRRDGGRARTNAAGAARGDQGPAGLGPWLPLTSPR